MQGQQFTVGPQCRAVGGLVGRTEDALRHIVLPGVDQFDGGSGALGDQGGLEHVVRVGPAAEATTHPRHLDVDVLHRNVHPGGDGWLDHAGGLQRAGYEYLVAVHPGEAVDRLHTVVGQIGGGVGAFQHPCGPGKSGFGVPVAPNDLSRLGHSLVHALLVVAGVLQPGRDVAGGFAPEAGDGFDEGFFRLPVDLNSPLSLEHPPGRLPDDGDQFRESVGIEAPFLVAVLVGFDAEDVSDAGHCLNVVEIDNPFVPLPEGGRVDDHRYQGVFLVAVHRVKRLAGHDAAGVDVFLGPAYDGEVADVLQFHLFRDSDLRGPGGHLPVGKRAVACGVGQHPGGGCYLGKRHPPLGRGGFL